MMMDNLVKKLLKQATTDVMSVPVVDHNMFAQLIVEDCAKWAEKCIEDEYFDVGNAIRERYGMD
jgi:hypothetical protein